MQPVINVAIPLEIRLPIDIINRNYILPIDIVPIGGTSITSINAILYFNNSLSSTLVTNTNIAIPMPNNTKDYVEVVWVWAFLSYTRK